MLLRAFSRNEGTSSRRTTKTTSVVVAVVEDAKEEKKLKKKWIYDEIIRWKKKKRKLQPATCITKHASYVFLDPLFNFMFSYTNICINNSSGFMPQTFGRFQFGCFIFVFSSRPDFQSAVLCGPTQLPFQHSTASGPAHRSDHHSIHLRSVPIWSTQANVILDSWLGQAFTSHTTGSRPSPQPSVQHFSSSFAFLRR